MDSNDLVLSLVPASGEPSDNAWQEECRTLLASLQHDTDLEARSQARPATDPEARAFSLQSFHDIAVTVVGSASAGAVASRLWDFLTTWLKRRHGSRCVIRTADGSEFMFEELTKDEALRLLSTHLRRTRPKPS